MSIIGTGVGTCLDCGAALRPVGGVASGLCARCDREPDLAPCGYCCARVPVDSLRPWDALPACEECHGCCVSCGTRLNHEMRDAGFRVCRGCA